MALFALPAELSSGAVVTCQSIALSGADGAATINFSAIPNRRAVYAFLDEHDHVVLVATTAHLRNTLARRLAEVPAGHHTRAVPYGQFCRRLVYFPANSPFAADLIFLLLVRSWYPETFGDMLSWRRPWFIEARLAPAFPRFIKTDAPENPALAAGPVDSRAAAGRLIETLEELFDLCRYYQILQQAPNGRACAYKDMGKCPAPCDGSIPMEHYRQQLAAAIQLARNLHATGSDSAWKLWVDAQEAAMRQAAAQLRFEHANNIKTRLARADILQTPAFAAVQAADKFCYLVLQPGKGRAWIEPYYVHGGIIQPRAPVHKRDMPAACRTWCAQVCAADQAASTFEPAQLWFAGLVTHHLYRGDADPGLYLPAQELQEAGDVEKQVEAWLKKPPRKMPGDARASTSGVNANHNPEAPADWEAEAATADAATMDGPDAAPGEIVKLPAERHV